MQSKFVDIQWELYSVGMSFNVVYDLAVDVHPDGADAWLLGKCDLVRSARVSESARLLGCVSIVRSDYAARRTLV